MNLLRGILSFLRMIGCPLGKVWIEMTPVDKGWSARGPHWGIIILTRIHFMS